MSKRRASNRLEDKLKKLRQENDDSSVSYDSSWKEGGGVTAKGVPALLYLDGDDIKASEKIASFDMDRTLIDTASGRKFSTDPKDWKIINDSVIPKLNAAYNSGYKIVVFSNQKHLEKNKADIKKISQKIIDIIRKIGIPIQVFLSTGETHFRKPSVGMWNYMKENCNSGVAIDVKNSFYVDDAAGRPKDWNPGKPKDFSCCDRMFASNVGITFYTPEEYFEKAAPVSFNWGSINPADILDAKQPTDECTVEFKQAPELLLMVGLPASGKSTFCKRFLQPQGYLIVNRDTLKTREKCLKVVADSLNKGKSVVVDNTNPSKASRREFLDIAQKNKVPCRCLFLTTPLEVAHHLNVFRQSQTKGKIVRIPNVGYNMYKSKFDEPEVSEGFLEVLKLDFVPKFESAEDEKLFRQWTC